MKTENAPINIEQLQGLLGVRVNHEGICCEIIEILEDGPSLILRVCDPGTVIQPDQHGEAHRRVPPMRSIPIFAADGSGYSAAFLALDLTETEDS